MFGTRVNLELLQHGAAQTVLGQHATHSGHEHALGLGSQHIAQGGGLQTAHPTGVAIVVLMGHLGAGHLDLFAVDHDDKVAVVHVTGKFGLMLAAQAVGDLAGQTTQHLILGVNHKPFVVDVFRGGAERLHRDELLIYLSQ